MNRILGSTYREKGTSWSSLPTSGFAETGFLYDLNGNIKTLTRNDKRTDGTTMDVLTYDYGTTTAQSNKLLKVTDAGDKVTGFIDGTNATNDYTYDLNGNMLTDQNKGITSSITYNHLNLPVLVTKGGNSIQYIYDATGRKLSQVTTFGGRTKQTDYVGEFVYENDVLQFINHEEGRVVVTNTTLIYTNSFESTAGITATNATLTAVTKNGTEKYVQVTPAGTVAQSGAFPIGTTFPVQPGERYLIRVKGYRTGTSAAYIAVKVNGIDVNWPGATLPVATDLTAPSQETWVEQTVTIPANSDQGMEVGVTWNTVTSPASIYLNEIEVTRLDNTTPEYQYNLKDHLGNVRVTFTTKQETEAALATLEAAKEDDERSKFVRYDNARLVKNYLFDHTNGSSPTTVEGSAQRLSGQGNEVYGLGRSLSVMPGDVISMEVYAKYIDKTQTNWTPALAALLGQIAAGTAGSVVVDGSTYTASTSSFPFPGDELVNTASAPGTGPEAYLSWLVYDRNHTFMPAKSGYKRMGTTAAEHGQDVAHEKLSGTLSITEAGYVYVFISNEEGTSAYEVYFDDFKVTQVKSPVIASNDYYPFGLTFNSASRENSVKQDYLYSGKEQQDELNLGWIDFGMRMYQPELGRFLTQDRFAEKYFDFTPYHYGANSPIMFVDVNGDSLAVKEIDAGSTDKFKQNIQNGSGGYWLANVDANTGIVSLSENKDLEGNMSKDQASFVKALSSVINGNGVATINLVNNSESVVIGDIANNIVDVGDMQKLGTDGKLTAQKALVHEVSENYDVQVNKMSPTSAHQRAGNAENRFGDAMLNPLNRFTTPTNYPNLTTLTIPVIGPPEQRGVISIHLYKNNVLNVSGNSIKSWTPTLKK
jgi:RHS repeat-associated protein